MKKQLVSGLMASALIFSYGAGAAFANEDSTGTTLPAEEILETIELNEEGTTPEATEEATPEEVTTDETTEETTTEDDVAVVDEEAAPSLVPGDFFYFVKTLMEKIQLAITVDDYKEAQLLADFAAERIAEANALIAEGKTEEAAELLQQAIQTQETATEELNHAEGTEEATEDVTEESTEETVVVEDEEPVVALDEPTTEATEVEVKLGNNINALLAALQHVENPKAQASLMKNIQKSFAKLDKKIAKLEKKYGITEAEVTEAEVTEETTEESTTEGTVETVVTEDQEVVTETEVIEDTTEEAVVVAAVTNKEQAIAKAEEKKQQGQVKAEEKKQQGQVKAEEKKQQGQVKAQEKKQQGQAKAEEKKNNAKNNN